MEASVLIFRWKKYLCCFSSCEKPFSMSTCWLVASSNSLFWIHLSRSSFCWSKWLRWHLKLFLLAISERERPISRAIIKSITNSPWSSEKPQNAFYHFACFIVALFACMHAWYLQKTSILQEYGSERKKSNQTKQIEHDLTVTEF